MRRRDVLTGGVALACLGVTSARAFTTGDARLRILLDSIEPGVPAPAALEALRSFDPADLSSGARLDLQTATWGLATDALIADRKPFRASAAAGEAAFTLLFERQFGARMDALAVARRLEAKASALTARADALLREEGLSSGSVGERLRRLARDSRWLYPDSPEGRAQAVTDMSRWLARAQSKLPELVPSAPLQPAIVRNFSAAELEAGRGGFRDPALGGRPAAYVVDLREIRRRPSWSLASVVHHELVPGHLVHQSLQDAAQPHRLRLHYAPAFSEGWAIYAEQLSDEVGLLRADRLATIGYLQWLLFRVGRGLADTRTHLNGWSAEQVTGFLADLQGEPMIFAPFSQDIDRIRAAPGVRAAEAMTWLGIADLRARVGARGGARRAAFHDAVLSAGAMPFALLAGHVRGRLPGSRPESKRTEEWEMIS